MGWLTYPSDFPGSQDDELREANQPLVSIVVPVYNTPTDRIGRCVGSLVAQSYGNIEIVVVDDGSEGDCAEYLNGLPDTDARIRVLRSGHVGVSGARNLGISAAKGEWIAFSDADDECAPAFVEEALSIALSLDCDLVCGSVSPLYAGEGKSARSDSFPCYVADSGGDEIRSLAFQMLGHVKYKSFTGPDFQGRGPGSKLYRASLMGGLEFDEGVSIGEDTLFNYRFIERCQRVAMAQVLWYWYYQYANSAVHSVDAGSWISSIDGIMDARREGEDAAPFVSRCAFMAAQGIVAIASALGLFAGRRKAVDLLAHAGKRGCFEPPVFEGFVIPPWRKLMVWLCARGRYSLAYFYWIVMRKVAGRERRKLSAEHGEAKG